MPALLPKPCWAAFCTKGELRGSRSSPVFHSQFPRSPRSPRGYDPGQGYPWDLGLCHTQSLGGDKQVTLDIERAQPQKVLEDSCSVHSRGARFFTVLQYPSSWKHSRTDDYVTVPSFLCTGYGCMPEHWSAGCDSDVQKFSGMF